MNNAEFITKMKAQLSIEIRDIWEGEQAPDLMKSLLDQVDALDTVEDTIDWAEEFEWTPDELGVPLPTED